MADVLNYASAGAVHRRNTTKTNMTINLDNREIRMLIAYRAGRDDAHHGDPPDARSYPDADECLAYHAGYVRGLIDQGKQNV